MGSLTTNRGATGAIFNDSRFSEFKQFVSQDREKDRVSSLARFVNIPNTDIRSAQILITHFVPRTLYGGVE